MKVRCPCCNGVGEIEDAPNVPLSPTQQRIYRIIARGELDCHTIVDLLYKDDPDGGPEYALVAFRAQVQRINKKLTNKKIKATKNGPGACYRIINVV